jgi:hypothetical protein
MKRTWPLAALAALLFCAVTMRASLEAGFIFPGASSKGQPYADVAAGPGHELVPLTTRDGTRIMTLFGGAVAGRGERADGSPSRPTVIFFYGNGACLAGMLPEFEGFRGLGANILMVEYPGYGMSEGRPSEKAFYAAADAGYDYLRHRPDIDPRRIVAAGWSIGAAVALDLAVRRDVSSLIIVSPFTTLPAVARAAVPWFPTSLIVRSRFDNLAKVPSVACPILIAHGTVDTIVPPGMAGTLAGAATSRVTSYTVTGAGHNDVFEVGGSGLWEAFRVAILAQK